MSFLYVLSTISACLNMHHRVLDRNSKLGNDLSRDFANSSISFRFLYCSQGEEKDYINIVFSSETAYRFSFPIMRHSL